MLGLAGMLGLQAGGGILNTIIGQTLGKQSASSFNPEDIKNRIVLTADKAKGMMTEEVQNLNDAQGANRLGILQSGAPSGAKLTAMKTITGQTAKERSKISGRIQKMQQKSIMDYLNLVAKHKAEVAAADNANRGGLATGIGQTLGSMGKTALLFGAGLLPKIGEDGGELLLPDVSGEKGKLLPDDMFGGALNG